VETVGLRGLDPQLAKVLVTTNGGHVGGPLHPLEISGSGLGRDILVLVDRDAASNYLTILFDTIEVGKEPDGAGLAVLQTEEGGSSEAG
jgi:hypothetical protein